MVFIGKLYPNLTKPGNGTTEVDAFNRTGSTRLIKIEALVSARRAIDSSNPELLEKIRTEARY